MSYGDAETVLRAEGGEPILVRLYRQHSPDPDLQELGALVGFFLAQKPQYSLSVRRLEDILCGDEEACAPALSNQGTPTIDIGRVRDWLKVETMDLFPPARPGPALRRSSLAG